jgi:hypothetical protein
MPPNLNDSVKKNNLLPVSSYNKPGLKMGGRLFFFPFYFKKKRLVISLGIGVT